MDSITLLYRPVSLMYSEAGRSYLSRPFPAEVACKCVRRWRAENWRIRLRVMVSICFLRYLKKNNTLKNGNKISNHVFLIPCLFSSDSMSFKILCLNPEKLKVLKERSKGDWIRSHSEGNYLMINTSLYVCAWALFQSQKPGHFLVLPPLPVPSLRTLLKKQGYYAALASAPPNKIVCIIASTFQCLQRTLPCPWFLQVRCHRFLPKGETRRRS